MQKTCSQVEVTEVIGFYWLVKKAMDQHHYVLSDRHFED